MFYYIDTASDAYERNETIMEERSMEYRQMKQRGDRTMRELGTARRLLMEEIREKKSVANSGKCKRVHCGRVRVRTASDVLSDRDWDRMNGHIRIYQLGRPLTRRQFLALPEDLRRLYVKLLQDKHGATRQQARQLTGEDYGLRFGEGDAQKWAAFLARGKR